MANKNIERLKDISARLKELGLPEDTLSALNGWIKDVEREQILIQGLADMASNFGRGSFSGTPDFVTEQRFRVCASETLKKAGYVYREYPQVPPDSDGWYLTAEGGG